MRADGKKLNTVDPMYVVASYIMSERSDACNSISVSIPYQPMHDYLAKKRAEGVKGLSFLSLITAAYVRTLAEFPFLNRFVVNKRIYARNEIAVGMVVLREDIEDKSMSKMYFEPTDTVFDVASRINEYVQKNREPASNSTDALIQTLIRSNFILNAGVGLFKFLDKHGWLPKSIIDASPFHCSMVISNLASIRTNHIYHHIYNFGTTSMILTMGTSQYETRMRKGETVAEKVIPLGIVMDERTGSGLMYAQAFRRLKELLCDPFRLETPPAKVVTEI